MKSMVAETSPEPPKESEEGFGIEGASVMVMDSSEDDEFVDNNSEIHNFGYELLPQENPLDANGDVDADSDHPNSGPVGDSHLNGVSMDNGASNGNIEPLPSTSDCNNRARTEMEINADEIRAAMRNVILPPSSFPPWAALVPESQLTEYVFMRANGRPNSSQLDPESPQR